MAKRTNNFIGDFGYLCLLALCLIAGAYLLKDSILRFDCTEDKLFTLSSTTTEMLQSLEKPVEIRFYYSEDMAQMPIPVKNYAKRIEDMLKEYQALSKGKIRLEKINPKPDTDAEESAMLDGITGQNGATLGIDGYLYLGASFRCEERTAPIPIFTLERESLLEYDLTNTLLSITNPTRHTVGIVSDLPLLGGAMVVGNENRILPKWHFINELGKNYDLLPLPLDVAAIPDKVDILMIVHPKGISEKTLYAIDQFLMKHGKILAFIDPLCVAELQLKTSKEKQYVMPDAASSLGRLLAAWGVSFTESEVVIDNKNATTIQIAPNEPPQTFPFVLNLNSDFLQADDSTTTDLSALLLFSSGAFKTTPIEGLAALPLIFSSKETQLIEPYITQRNSEDILRDFVSDNEEKVFALRLSGTFHTAFPEKNGMDSSTDNAKVILVGDADMLYDPFCVRKTEVNGQTVWQPATHNIAFAQNALDSLVGENRMAKIRARGFNSRPFTRFQSLAREAEKQYNDELDKLTAELEGVKKELYEIQKKNPAEEKQLISKEQREAVARYRKKEAETNRNIKALRKKMRKEITSAENRITLLNIAIMPLLTIFACVIRMMKK